MAKVLFQLPGYYEGIRARRIRQSGRLWLVRVVSDPDKREGGTFRPYWFVLIKAFDLQKDRASGATSIGIWRFGYEDQAYAKFAELEPFYPPFPVRPNRHRDYLGLPLPTALLRRWFGGRRVVSLRGGFHCGLPGGLLGHTASTWRKPGAMTSLQRLV